MSKIIKGDCVSVMRSWEDNVIDLTVTSPPYDNLRDYNGFSFDFEKVANELFRITKEGGVVVWIVGDATIKGSETGTSFKQALYFKEIGFNLHDTMIWHKHSFNYDPRRHRYKQHYEFMFILSKGKPRIFNPIKDVPVKTAGQLKKSSKRLPNGKIRDYGYIKMNDFQARSNIWYIPQETKSSHPAPFPEKLAEDHILSWSNEGDLVLDPMCGSGTTCKMAKLNNRRYIGIDCSEEYCSIAKQRINDALHENDGVDKK
jgi:site-specific DNA-methyltransferase (adenine-specific)